MIGMQFLHHPVALIIYFAVDEKQNHYVNFRIITRYVSYNLFGCLLGHRNALGNLVMVEVL
jgi:hypothetical protein